MPFDPPWDSKNMVLLSKTLVFEASIFRCVLPFWPPFWSPFGTLLRPLGWKSRRRSVRFPTFCDFWRRLGNFVGLSDFEALLVSIFASFWLSFGPFRLRFGSVCRPFGPFYPPGTPQDTPKDPITPSIHQPIDPLTH